ncbi:proteasome assembly chaperone 2 [Equus asinus]|uniref:proteasome assembly chaperone 2 n=1 Tax=Equus asinus TaxID=9793 RepID=UPI0038F751A4
MLGPAPRRQSSPLRAPQPRGARRPAWERQSALSTKPARPLAPRSSRGRDAASGPGRASSPPAAPPPSGSSLRDLRALHRLALPGSPDALLAPIFSPVGIPFCPPDGQVCGRAPQDPAPRDSKDPTLLAPPRPPGPSTRVSRGDPRSPCAPAALTLRFSPSCCCGPSPPGAHPFLPCRTTMFVPCGESAPDLAAYTLLMPAVSVGNVGQLAVDLIISTLNMCKIGYFYTDCLVPMVGNNPYATAEENSAELSTNAEESVRSDFASHQKKKVLGNRILTTK